MTQVVRKEGVGWRKKRAIHWIKVGGKDRDNPQARDAILLPPIFNQ